LADTYIKISIDNGQVTLNKVILELPSVKLGQTYIIDTEKPEILWDLLYNLAGLPFPKITPLKEPPPKELPPEKPTPETLRKEKIEQTLMAMSAKKIVEYVFKERGLKITTDIKSKNMIIRQALKSLL
jgi:hypothetical protein